MARIDPLTRLGPERIKRLTVNSQVGDDVIPQLARLGLTPADVRYVANSHLHFAHCGGNEFFPRATFFVHPLDYRMIDGEHDVFGDGSVVLLPTYGHTPGHQSLLVRTGKNAQIVCASDACYTRENMDRDVLPKVLWNPATRWRRSASYATRPAPRCSTVTTRRSGKRRRAPAPVI